MSSDKLTKIDLSDASNKTDALFTTLTKMIAEGELPPYFTFPNENNMCHILSIGRGTLREVYKALELKGYITRSKSGTTVNDISFIAQNEPFDTSLIFSGEESLVEFLLIVEPEAARLAARKATSQELEQIYDAMMQLEEANRKKSISDINQYNTLFHRRILDATHNPILISSICTSRKSYDDRIVQPMLNNSPSSVAFIDLCLMQHYNIYYALKTHNEDKAFQLMKEHFTTDINYYASITLKPEPDGKRAESLSDETEDFL